MMKFFICVFSLFSLSIFSQNFSKTYIDLPQELVENSNACFLENNVKFRYESRNKIVTERKYFVTFFNRDGFENFNKNIYYSKSTKVTKAQAVVYNASGNVVKKIKKSDFKDYSFLDGFSIISDARVLVLDYVPTSYPFTLELYTVTESVNTAFARSWSPIQQIYNSVLKASLTIEFPSDIGFFYEENALDSYNFVKEQTSNKLTYEFKIAQPIVPEYLQPSYDAFLPNIHFGVSYFHLEGIDGYANNWQDLGKWIDEHLLKEVQELPEKAIIDIKNIIGNERDPLKKAALVYKYVQDNTRYISIQLGIGGWKPMLASDVDRLKYGDCKALTNYTQQLLKAVDVPSYYALVYSGGQKKDFNQNLVALQGDHAFLAIPHQEKMYWLECTNQESPFGFIGTFTDDREVLVITPEGGKIFKTTNYTYNENIQVIEGKYSINDKGTLSALLNITSKGQKFNGKQKLEKSSSKDIESYYVNFFSSLMSPKILGTNFKIDLNTVTAEEEVYLESQDYLEKRGNNYILKLNAFNLNLNTPPKVKDRKLPFQISRGYKEIDHVLIDLQSKFKVDFIPESAKISTEYGSYEIKITETPEGLLYQRTFVLYEGLYAKEKYETYRDFISQVIQFDHSKALLQLK
jgi:transglutaminase-like putative cysteine protease